MVLLLPSPESPEGRQHGSPRLSLQQPCFPELAQSWALGHPSNGKDGSQSHRPGHVTRGQSAASLVLTLALGSAGTPDLLSKALHDRPQQLLLELSPCDFVPCPLASPHTVPLGCSWPEGRAVISAPPDCTPYTAGAPYGFAGKRRSRQV